MTSPLPKTTDRPGFIDKQYEFAAHIRDPEANPRPADVEERRMKIYRELFYNNVNSFMESGFPVLRSLFDDDAWHLMIRDYYSRHQSHTPLFPEMTKEFIDYLQNERNNPDDPPFMVELAHYEWIEMALSVDDNEIDLAGIDPKGDLLEGSPVLSPLAYPLSYAFEVHRISSDYRPDKPGDQPTHIVVYRDKEDDVGFMELNTVTARLLQLFDENDSMTGRQALEQIAQELQHSNPDIVIKGGLDTLSELKHRDIILGTKIK